MRRVLIPLPPVDLGGLQIFSCNINAGMLDRGWQQVVVVPDHASHIIERLRDYGVEVIPHPLPRFRRNMGENIKVLRTLHGSVSSLIRDSRVNNIDIVQAVGAHHPHGYALSKALKRPLVWQLHSSALPYPLRLAVGSFIRLKADSIMTNGWKVSRDFFGKADLGQRHKVFYAPVDTGKFRPDLEKRSKIRGSLNISENDIVVGTVGNRGWQKNHQLFIKLAEDIIKKYKNVKFVLLGADIEGYKDEYYSLVKRPAMKINERFPDSIKFVDAVTDVENFIQSFDVFVLTSHAEGVPISLFEAMATGLPTVSTQVGSIAEIIVDGQTGWLCSPGDRQALVQKVSALIENKNMRKLFGRQGRARILESFSLENVVEAHLAAYEFGVERYRQRP